MLTLNNISRRYGMPRSVAKLDGFCLFCFDILVSNHGSDGCRHQVLIEGTLFVPVDIGNGIETVISSSHVT